MPDINPDINDVICSGYKKCMELKGAVHTFQVGNRTVHQRPENCSGREPHRFRHEEDASHFCSFVNERVEAKRIAVRVF